MTRYETEMITLGQETLEEDLAQGRRLTMSLADPSHPQDVRDLHHSAHRRNRLLETLPTLPAVERISAADASDLLRAVWEKANRRSGPAYIQVPGLPEPVNLEVLEDYGISWTAGLLRESISAIIPTGKTPEAVLKAVGKKFRMDAFRARLEREKVERELVGLARERLLPDDTTLEKIARYEAHLGRQFYAALHEFEAMQARRVGGVAPLARLDVQGMSSNG